MLTLVAHVRPLPLLTCIFVLGLISIAHQADAAEGGMRLRVDWSSFADTYRMLSAGSSSPGHDTASNARVVTSEASAWFGSGAMVSILLRDWQGATHLAGGPMAVTDAIRASSASRMLVARVGLGGGRIVPYLHVGAGQWREPEQRLRDAPVEVAGEAGVGFETLLARSCAFAVEYNWTALYIDDHRTNGIAPQMSGVFAVARWAY